MWFGIRKEECCNSGCFSGEERIQGFQPWNTKLPFWTSPSHYRRVLYKPKGDLSSRHKQHQVLMQKPRSPPKETKAWVHTEHTEPAQSSTALFSVKNRNCPSSVKGLTYSCRDPQCAKLPEAQPKTTHCASPPRTGQGTQLVRLGLGCCTTLLPSQAAAI